MINLEMKKAFKVITVIRELVFFIIILNVFRENFADETSLFFLNISI